MDSPHPRGEWSSTSSLRGPLQLLLLTASLAVSLMRCGSAPRTSTVSKPGEPTLVQHVSSSSSRDGGMSPGQCYHLQLPNGATAGNAIIVGFTVTQSPTIGVTDDQGDAYRTIQNYYDSSNGRTVGIAAAFNVTAGARAINVCLASGGTNGWFQAMASEFANVTGIDGSGSSADSNGTSVAAGSVTPTQTGDLVYQVVVNGTTSAMSQSSFVAGSQSNISWQLLSADLGDGFAAQYGVYNSTGAINPAMSMGTSQHWASSAVLFQSGATGGVPTGMRIIHLMHQALPGQATAGAPFTNPALLQFASSGNLIVAVEGGGYPVCENTSITDSNNNTWQQAGLYSDSASGGTEVVQTYYTANANTATNLSLTVTFDNSNCDWNILFYDVVGAATSPLDTTTGGYGTQSSGGNLSTGFSITPSQGGELIFSQIMWQDNTANGLVGMLFDSSIWDGEPISGPDPDDENNGWGHYVTPNTSAVTFTWTELQSGLAAEDWASMAVAFEAADTPQN